MFKPKTFSEFCQAMQTRATVEVNGIVGVINTISAEDGSGRNWNVTLVTQNSKVTTFVRT